MKNYYQVLGIEEGATFDEIKTAYKEYVVKFHPDKHNGDVFFKERFQEIQEAYEYISNEKQKTNSIYSKSKNTSYQSEAIFPKVTEYSASQKEVEEGEIITITWNIEDANIAILQVYNGYKWISYNIPIYGSKEIKIIEFKDSLDIILCYAYIPKGQNLADYNLEKSQITITRKKSKEENKNNPWLNFIISLIGIWIILYSIGNDLLHLSEDNLKSICFIISLIIAVIVKLLDKKSTWI
jgi:DnaJ-class molecular chaperone with C-terminal Zn finger domain